MFSKDNSNQKINVIREGGIEMAKIALHFFRRVANLSIRKQTIFQISCP
jgi:hypothetical protein